MNAILERNRAFIPGGISSVNRAIDPPIAFARGEGAYLWDTEGKRYIDYHAAFAPYFLGHNFPPVNRAVADVLGSGESLFGAGPALLEGVLAELICKSVPGVVRPVAGYLEGLRKLADELGFLLIFDEVKTGFRHALGGYAAVSGVIPDLVVYGKAIANGFPLAALGGKRKFMDFIDHPDASKRPFVAGTYNGHPTAVAAAIRTIEYLRANEGKVYPHVESLGVRMQKGLEDIFARRGVPACVARQGSAFSFYFMPEPPRDLHDIVQRHDAGKDVALRRALIAQGVFFVPIATKQCSISAAHTAADIDFTLDTFESRLQK